MGTEHTSMWTEASRDIEAEQAERRFALAKVASAGVWPFLAAAKSPPEFGLRRERVIETLTARIGAVIGEGLVPTVMHDVLASLEEDWKTLHEERTAAALTEATATQQVRLALLEAEATAGDSTMVHVSKLPECDIHKYVLGKAGVAATYDGATIDGPWAHMCEECFHAKGMGLGLGRGQRLVVAASKIAVVGSGANTYVCHWKGKTAEVRSDTTYGAQKTAISEVWPKAKGGDITVMLAKKGDEDYVHDPAVLGSLGTEGEQSGPFARTADFKKGAPFAGYADFAACVAANKDKDDPEAYCGSIKHKVEDKKSSLQTEAASPTQVGGGAGASWRDSAKYHIGGDHAEDDPDDHDSFTGNNGMRHTWTSDHSIEREDGQTYDFGSNKGKVYYRSYGPNPADVSRGGDAWHELPSSQKGGGGLRTSMLKTADMTCPDCGGTGKVPDMGGGQDGYEDCGTCGGSGTVPDYSDFEQHSETNPGESPYYASLGDLTDEEVLEAEAMLSTEGWSMQNPFKPKQQQPKTPLHPDWGEQFRKMNEDIDASYGDKRRLDEEDEDSPLVHHRSGAAKTATMYFVREHMKNGRPYDDDDNTTTHDHLEDAQARVDSLEKQDKANGTYRPDRWSILRISPKASSLTSVACKKCTAGKDPSGGQCDYCDGAGSLDATMAMLKEADGWGQGLTAEAFGGAGVRSRADELIPKTCAHVYCRKPAVKDGLCQEHLDVEENEKAWHTGANTDAEGTDRYQRTKHPSTPDWVHDAWGAEQDPEPTSQVSESPMTPQAERPAGQRAIEKQKAIYDEDGLVQDRVPGRGAARQVTAEASICPNCSTSNPSSAKACKACGWKPGDPIGKGASLQTQANPYDPTTNPFASQGPGNPGSDMAAPRSQQDEQGDVQQQQVVPQTTRPRVQPTTPAEMRDPADDTFSGPNTGEHSLTNMPKAPGTGDGGSAFARLRESQAQFTEPPSSASRLASRVALKADEIVAGLAVSNPGMDRQTAAQVAVETIRRYPGVVTAAPLFKSPHLPDQVGDHAHPVPDMNVALQDYLDEIDRQHGHKAPRVVEQ